ncbi:MAG: hypothetical protein J0I20_29800 [Chloroflexi bacterium]|nr:hypothetical protein [Chloroflexota bacterium]
MANLLNPAFCILLLREAIRGFEEEKSQGMPYSLVFFPLPLLLYAPIRQALPNSIRTKMFNWLKTKSDISIEFPEQANFYSPHTREALSFGLSNGIISITDTGLLKIQQSIDVQQDTDTEEVRDLKNKARFVGRWLALAGEDSTIYRMWGVQP